MAKKLDPKKEQQEWLQNILLDMLKEEENKYCADCQAKTPRWAAWNLGVFICIRCAGIHRNLGVHISKVRSVNLDSWTPEQVQSMRVMGNDRARKVYEHDLPEHFRRPTTDHQMEQFIRSKYEQKRYIMKDFTYPHIDVKDLRRPNVLAQKKIPTAKFAGQVSEHRSAQSHQSASQPHSSAGVANLLDLDAPSAAAASGLATTSTAAHNNASLIDDFGSLDLGGNNVAPASVAAAASSDLDDMFGSFVSAPSSNPSVAPPLLQSASLTSVQTNGNATTESSGLFGLDLGGMTSGNANDGEKKSTADILSLFSSAQPAPPLIAPGGFTAFGLQAATQNQSQQSLAAQAPNQMNFANFGMNNAPSSMTNSMPASLSLDGFGLTPNSAGSAAAMSQSHSGGQFGGLLGSLSSDLSSSISSMPPSSLNSAQFPNPFGPPTSMPANFGTGHAPLTKIPSNPASPPAAFKIPNKSNAFADLSIGKVMNMNYMSGGKPNTTVGGAGKSAGTATTTVAMNASAQPIPATGGTTSNTQQLMNLDDLLGGF